MIMVLFRQKCSYFVPEIGIPILSFQIENITQFSLDIPIAL